MTRVFEKFRQSGGTRLLVIGVSTYPDAKHPTPKVPGLDDISSAFVSAVSFMSRAIGQWETRFVRPLSTVDLLLNAPGSPHGVTCAVPGIGDLVVDAPTMANVAAAKKAWLNEAGSEDTLVFYCCGHGIWLPSTGRTFLTASFGADPDNPWRDAIALDDFALGLGEVRPRQQWLIFDCCNNTPTEALTALRPNPDPLIGCSFGGRKAAENMYGRLSQVTLSSASVDSAAFGKQGRASRLMEALLEACEGSGARRPHMDTWWVDQQGIEESLATYGERVAKLEEEDYFTFARVTQTDAAEVPRFLSSDLPPPCTLVVLSEPPHLLKQATLTVKEQASNALVGGQKAGATASARYRVAIPSWRWYDVEVQSEVDHQATKAFALPPMIKTTFKY